VFPVIVLLWQVPDVVKEWFERIVKFSNYGIFYIITNILYCWVCYT
jgi:hypothetical protein